MPLHHTRGRRSGGRVLENVDHMAVRRFWESLEVEDQLRLLRFEDSKLARRLYLLRAELLRSDLACYQRGIFTRDLRSQASMALMLDAFEFDLDVSAAGVHEPRAFITKIIFVERDNFFDLIEEELGGFLTDGRPALRRSQWASIFDANPSSWQEFLRRVLQMIELALLDGYQQHELQQQQCISPEILHSNCNSEDAGDEHLLAALGVPSSPQQATRRSRAKKLRKKEATIAAAAATIASTAGPVEADLWKDSATGSEDMLSPASESMEKAVARLPLQECSSESCGSSTQAEQLEDSLETSLDGTTTSAGESQVLSKSSSTGSMPSLSSDDETVAALSRSEACHAATPCLSAGSMAGEEEQTPRHAYAALFGPPPTILVPACRNCITPGANVTCSAWVCNEQMGASAEWNWVAFEQAHSAPTRNLCARVRNTFLELSSPTPRAARNLHLRAQSADAARDRCC